MSDKRLWVEKDESGVWTARSSDGAEVKFGHAAGMFNPGDLMKLALAGCAALSSNAAIEHSLGDQAHARINVDGRADQEENRYLDFTEELTVDGSELSAEQREKLTEQIKRAIERGCTVGRTYAQATPYRLAVNIKG